ncbi:MAG TPA: hypothetical protein VHW70_14245 [Edaphobacter sp.]|jgi:hypothetical protein|nr:hypothetical protein [Edaphobacter sp.]
MKSDTLASAVRALSLLLSVSATCALAQNGIFGQDQKPAHFSGLFNDYVPLSATISGSPYEMHGQWSMDLNLERGTGDFAADMTMSGFGRTAAGAVDPNQPIVNPHTHHIRLTNMRITWEMTGCPAYATPTLKGFQLNGTVSLMTGNGSNGSFETDPPTSTLQVCVTGATDTQFTIANSNMTLVFGGPAAAKHFGSQAIHGVVRIAPTEPFGKFR